MNDFGDRLRRHVDELTPEGVAPFHEVSSRRARRRRRRRAVLAGGAAMAAVVAVTVGIGVVGGGDPSPDHRAAGSSPSPSDRPDPSYTWGDEPSPVVLRLADGDVALSAWGYCWTGPPSPRGTAKGICVDSLGPSTRDLPSAGEHDALDFWFGLKGWDFRATFTELDAACPRSHTVRAERIGDQTFRLQPAGPPGRYRVDLFGTGEAGDVTTSFAWTTPVGGPGEEPSAHLALLRKAGDYAVAPRMQLVVEGLGFQPDEVEAEVVARTARGIPIVVDATLNHPGTCPVEGSLSFSGQPPVHPEATLGPAPFTYEVRLTLDGEEYVGTAVWPRDQIKGQRPHTRLTFTPPLPGPTPD
ncbi:hypothetical protein [Nocardioides pacificus]